MVTLDWKNLAERADGKDPYARMLSDPIGHQGLRNALRRAYPNLGEDLPDDLRKLLARIP